MEWRWNGVVRSFALSKPSDTLLSPFSPLTYLLYKQCSSSTGSLSHAPYSVRTNRHVADG